MLIFFLITGTLTTPPDQQVKLISLENSDRSPPPDMVFIRSDGSLSWRGEPASPENVILNWQQANDGETPPMRIAADRELSALMLLEIVKEFKSKGVQHTVLVTERKDN